MSTENRRQMHVNSLLAFYQGQQDLFSKREKAILGELRRMKAATDREIMLALKFSDMNSVRPRLSELLADGILLHATDTEDPVTHKQVRVLCLAPDPRRPQPEFNFGVGSAA